MNKRMVDGLKLEEVAMRVGVSYQTLNRWYKFKKENPDNELCALLPDYVMVNSGTGNIRVWNPDDIWKLIEFRTKVKQGRTGKMGKYGGTGTRHGKTDDIIK